MADDPTVIDPTLLKKAADATDDLAQANTKLAASYARLSKEQELLQNRLAQLKKENKDNGEEATKLKQRLEEVKVEIEKLSSQIGSVDRLFIDMSRDMKDMSKDLKDTTLHGLQLDTSLGKLVQSLRGVGVAGAMLVTDTGRALLEPFRDGTQVADVFGTTLNKLNQVFRKHAEAQDLVNVGFLAMGKSMEDATGQGSRVIDAFQKSAAQFFISAKEQAEFAKATRTIPGALKAMTEESEFAGRSVTKQTQLMLAARGAGIGMAEGAQVAERAFESFGVEYEKVGEAFAAFKTAADAGGVSVQLASKQIEAASSPLTIFHKGIDQAKNVWLTFTKALQDVPAQQVGGLLTTVTTGIANMNLNTQAFVAQMTGMAQGATALGGALQMELEMREPGGKGMEKNLERVQQAISRLGGGRIITLQEAAQTPALEMQFQLQRQLAGQMLGVQGSAQQSRVLEVLQGVERGGITSASATKTMQDLMADGQKAQDASTTAMEKTAMGIGRTNEFLTQLVNIERAAGIHLAEIGEALGARKVGDKTEPSAWAQAARAMPRAGRAAARAARRAVPEIGRTTELIVSGVLSGLRAHARQQAFDAKTSVGGALIRADRPGPAEQLRTEPIETASPRIMEELTLMLQKARILQGRHPQADDPFSVLRGGRQATDRLPLPFFSRRPEERFPTEALAGEAGRAPGRRAGRGAPATAEAEYRAESLVPDTITVKVVCEQCSHKLGQKIEKLSRHSRGETD